MTIDAAQYLPACEQLMHQLFYCLDESMYDRLAALFEEDGVWHRQGEVLKGRAQILRAMAKRPPTQHTRHIITNSFVESQAPDLVNLVAYMTAYRFDDGSMHEGPVQIARPFRISVVRAALRHTQGAWKFVEMDMTPAFEFGAETVLAGAGK